MHQPVRLRIIENLKESISFMDRSINERPSDYIKELEDLVGHSLATSDVADGLSNLVVASGRLIEYAEAAKTIVFPSGQANVFLDALRKIDFNLDFHLPFPVTLLQFSEPIFFHLPMSDLHPREVGAILVTLEEYKSGPTYQVFVVFKNLLHHYPECWRADGSKDSDDYVDDERELAATNIKNLVTACIGYINCENVYLQREGEVPEAVNAKRERKGKSRLEPYYVCRIRGVQYDSAGNPTGEGAKHGIRYDVRGHFRRMDGGKTTWVRPHQRGLANELYVPKTYVVAKA